MKISKLILLSLTLIGAEHSITASNRITARRQTYAGNKRAFIPQAPHIHRSNAGAVKRQQSASAQEEEIVQHGPAKKIKPSEATTQQASANTSKASPVRVIDLINARAAGTEVNEQKECAEKATDQNLTTNPTVAASTDIAARAKRKEMLTRACRKSTVSKINDELVFAPKNPAKRKKMLELACRKSDVSKINDELVFASKDPAASQASAAAPAVDKNADQALMIELFGNDWRLDSDSDINNTDDSASQGSLKAKYHCTFPGCKYSSPFPNNLSRHMNIHSRAEKVKCFVCDMLLVDKNSLKRHIARHKKNKLAGPFKCRYPQCPDSFESERTRTNHENFHKFPVISCTVCGEQFGTKTALSSHARVHPTHN